MVGKPNNLILNGTERGNQLPWQKKEGIGKVTKEKSQEERQLEEWIRVQKESHEASQQALAAERIAMKIAKGEKLTAEEEQLMDSKYPDLKKDAQQARQEAQMYKERLKNAKTEEERNQVTTTTFGQVAARVKKGT